MTTNLGARLRQVIKGVAPEPSHLGTSEPRNLGTLDVIADVLGGRSVDSSEGSVLVVDRHYAAGGRHGRQPIGEIVETIEHGCGALQLLARAWPGRSARPYTSRLCFLDIETTGLAGGAGTTAFLVGCAVIEDGGLNIRQFLLPGFEHERALLAALGEWLTLNYGIPEPKNHGTPEHPNLGTSEPRNLGTQEPRNPGTLEPRTLVTFNGRTFDLPLIETRYLFHRLPFPAGELPHLDMLHPARRLWKQRPTIAGPALDDDSCRLTVLERHLAGYHRIGDVPGFELPSRYFRFIRNGEVHPLEAVLEHNRIDLISLALVTARAIVLIDEGPAATSHPREALGLGRVYERSSLMDNAEASYAHAAALAARVGREPDVRAEALRRLALCRRRTRRMREAAEAWQDVLTVPGCPLVWRREAREALAIHHEHRSGDLDTARSLVLDVLAEATGMRVRSDAEYRLQRIQRKLTRREQQPLLTGMCGTTA